MRFQQWFEGETGSADQYGNDVAPEDRGLVRPQYLSTQPPDSAHANQLFGRDYMGVDRSADQRQAIYRVLNHLLYNHGLEPDQIMGMSSDDLLPLVQCQRPTESWNMSRFLNMIKSAARSEVEQF